MRDSRRYRSKLAVNIFLEVRGARYFPTLSKRSSGSGLPPQFVNDDLPRRGLDRLAGAGRKFQIDLLSVTCTFEPDVRHRCNRDAAAAVNRLQERAVVAGRGGGDNNSPFDRRPGSSWTATNRSRELGGRRLSRGSRLRAACPSCRARRRRRLGCAALRDVRYLELGSSENCLQSC